MTAIRRTGRSCTAEEVGTLAIGSPAECALGERGRGKPLAYRWWTARGDGWRGVEDGGLRVAEEGHEAEVHVDLIVAMEESGAGVVGGEVDLGGGVGGDDEDVLEQAGE
jgi:hypothetical protein